MKGERLCNFCCISRNFLTFKGDQKLFLGTLCDIKNAEKSFCEKWRERDVYICSEESERRVYLFQYKPFVKGWTLQS